MQFVLFTKHWRDLDIEEMVAATLEIGGDGWDLAVRPAYAVNPDNVEEALPRAVDAARGAGLSVPMITTDASFIDPDASIAEKTARAMRKAGIPIAKLGYFRYGGDETSYWETVSSIREAFRGFEELGKAHGVSFCYHTHSNYFGLNGAALMHLLEGRDPQWLGAYLDTGHLHYCGEPFPMAVDMVGPYLKRVSLKDTFFTQTNGTTPRPEIPELDDETPTWTRTIVPAGYGVVRWADVFRALATAGYDDVCSVHCEFASPNTDAFARMQKREVAFLRRARDNALV